MTQIPTTTPEKHPLILPTPALAEAIAQEWMRHPKYRPTLMPLTALAFTAIDRIEPQKEMIIEAMMTYVDTDTLSYHSTSSDLLRERQKAQWDPIVHWISSELNAIWKTTQGVMPIEQSEALHTALREQITPLSAMQLAGVSMLASLCSSVILAFAVHKRRITGQQAFTLSRLEEDTQAEQWGVDPEAQSRADGLQAEILSAERFLRLLETT